MKLIGTGDELSYELRLSAPRLPLPVPCRDATPAISADGGQQLLWQSQGLDASFITSGNILWDQRIYLDTQQAPRQPPHQGGVGQLSHTQANHTFLLR